MKIQMTPDFEFLQRLKEEYLALYLESYPKGFSSLPPPDPNSEIGQLRSMIESLSYEIQILKNQENKRKIIRILRIRRPSTASKHIDTTECDHWRKLLDTHSNVIHILELQQAEQGSMFHYSQAIELDERRKRVVELREQIEQNCT